MIPFRHDVASESEATKNADSAPDLERDRFLRPLLEILRARKRPMNVRAMSVAGTAGIAEIIGVAWREVAVEAASSCCGRYPVLCGWYPPFNCLLGAADGAIEKHDALDARSANEVSQERRPIVVVYCY